MVSSARCSPSCVSGPLASKKTFCGHCTWNGLVAATMAGGSPLGGADELPVSAVRRDAASIPHSVRQQRGHQTHRAHAVLAAGQPAHRLSGQAFKLFTHVQRHLCSGSLSTCWSKILQRGLKRNFGGHATQQHKPFAISSPFLHEFTSVCLSSFDPIHCSSKAPENLWPLSSRISLLFSQALKYEFFAVKHVPPGGLQPVPPYQKRPSVYAAADNSGQSKIAIQAILNCSVSFMNIVVLQMRLGVTTQNTKRSFQCGLGREDGLATPKGVFSFNQRRPQTPDENHQDSRVQIFKSVSNVAHHTDVNLNPKQLQLECACAPCRFWRLLGTVVPVVTAEGAASARVLRTVLAGREEHRPPRHQTVRPTQPTSQQQPSGKCTENFSARRYVGRVFANCFLLHRDYRNTMKL